MRPIIRVAVHTGRSVFVRGLSALALAHRDERAALDPRARQGLDRREQMGK